jgi:hypothetical protein
VAHTLYTPTQAATSTLAAVRYLSVLPRLVRQDFQDVFVAGRGRTVDVVLPVTIGPARTYSQANRDARAAIVFDELAQTTKPVTMGEQIYSAVRLPDDFATFTLTSLENQVLVPQATVVAERAVEPLVAEIAATPGPGTGEAIPGVAADGSNVLEVMVAARRVLNGRTVPWLGGGRVPVTDRVIVVGAAVEAAFLRNEMLQKVNESGDGGDMLRRAIIGNLFGFTIVPDYTLPEDFAVAFHRDAFVHVTRPSRSPEGAAKSATVSADGFALRWIQHYNPLQLEDQSVVDCFVGVDTIIPEFAVSFGMA